MITEEQFKTCVRAYFPECEFEKGKNSRYNYNILKTKCKIFPITFIDCMVYIHGFGFPYLCMCEEYLCHLLRNIKEWPKRFRAKEN